MPRLHLASLTTVGAIAVFSHVCTSTRDTLHTASKLMSSSGTEHVMSKTGILAPYIGNEHYRRNAHKRLAVERSIGRMLCRSEEMQTVARQIRILSGATELSQEDTEELEHYAKVNKGIGGSQDLKDGKDTLDANVLATHLKLDRKENDDPDFKDKVLRAAGVDNKEPSRRTNRFNLVTSYANPIWPWNCHNFDMDVAEIRHWGDFPFEIQIRMEARWFDKKTNLKTCQELSKLPSLSNVKGPCGYDLVRDLFAFFFNSPKDRKKLMHEILGISWSTTRSIEDELRDEKDRSVNPLNEHFRQHRTGMLSNVVRAWDEDDPAVEAWISGALANLKPIISGPSGHTLRFLNHWAWVREQARNASKQMDVYPSLAEARLLMMANMMPPKNHHSYHEIMSASIGITDGVEVLGYAHPDDYSDLRNDTDLGQKLFGKMTFNQETWDEHTEDHRINTPGPTIKTPNELAQWLLAISSNLPRVQMLLHVVPKSLLPPLLPIVDMYAKNNTISEAEAQAVRALISEAYNANSQGFFANHEEASRWVDSH